MKTQNPNEPPDTSLEPIFAMLSDNYYGLIINVN